MDATEYDSILAFAIDAEIEAQKFYQALSEKVKDDHLKKMFADFVKEEKKHEAILSKFRAEGTGHIHFKGASDFKVSETVADPKVSDQMKPADAIALAMKNEENAMNHYNSLADNSLDPEQKKIFRELASMELEHKTRMEKAFVDIGYPEVW